MSFLNKNKKKTLVFIALSFLTNITYSYFLSFTERGLPLFDWFNIGINIFWLGILLWIAWDIHLEKQGDKETLLFLACIVVLLTGFDLFEEDGIFYLALISMLEALLLFSAYFFAPTNSENKSNK